LRVEGWGFTSPASHCAARVLRRDLGGGGGGSIEWAGGASRESR